MARSTEINHKHYSGRLLTCNVLYNLAGHGLPILAAIISIPFLVRGLGTERFGVLTLSWVVVGYFSLFDLGVGRATTKFVAEYLAKDLSEELISLIWTSIYLLFFLGILAGITVAAFTPLLVKKIFILPENLIEETLKTFYFLAVSFPFVISTAGARGVLEAQQRFAVVNAIRVPASISNFVLPLIVVQFSTSLHHVVAVMVASRLVVFMVFSLFCFNSIPGLKEPRRPTVKYIRILTGFGGWLTVSSIIGPFMARMDRFIIGAMLSMSAVAYYAIPFDLVTKLWVLSGSLLGVLFPVFSAYSATEKERFRLLYERSLKYILIALSPMVFVIVLMAEPLLKLWLGQEFAVHSALVMQVLSVGVIISSIARVPAAAIQAMGKPDITAKLHMVELPVYLAMLWFLIPSIGIVGVAAAYTLRISLDVSALLFISHYKLGLPLELKGRFMKSFLGIIGLLFLSIYFTAMDSNILHRLLVLLALITSFALYSWKFLLDVEKENLGSLMKKMFSGSQNEIA